MIAKTVRRKKWLCCVWGFVLPMHAFASDNYLDLSLEQLLDITVVSASKKNEKVVDAPAAIYVITREDIIRSGATTVPDALRMAPGVDVARADANSWAISIRGFNSVLANKLLVLVDGRTLYNPVFGGALWEAHDLMLENIERIEVVRGPGGSLWGANAVNGVINITTRRARDTQGTLASVLAGNEELGSVSLRRGASFGDQGFYRVYGKGFKRDASYKPLVGGDSYDEWDGWRSGFRADWGDEFTLQGDAYRTSTQQLKPNFSLVAPYAAIKQQNIVYDGVNLLGRWLSQGSDGAQLSVQSYIDWARRDEPFNFIDDRTIYDAEMQYNFAPLGAHEVIAGAGIRYLADNETGNRNVAFSPQQRSNQVYNTFLQDKITLVPETWFVTLGSKFEHNSFSGFEVQPNIRLQWHPSQNQTLWSAVSRAVRTPTPIEEDLTSTIATAAKVRAAFVPNDNFKSEQLTAYELGYRNQFTASVSADFTVFYNDYDHLSTTAVQPITVVNNGVDPVHMLIPVKFTNDMKGRSQGLEAALSWVADENLKLTLNYSLLRMSLTAAKLAQTPAQVAAQETAEKLSPEHQLGIKAFWNISHSWTLDSTAVYVDKLPATKVDDYVRLDINLGGQLDKSLKINLVAQDLLDNHHREFASAADLNAGETERSIFAKLTWEF